MYLISEKRRNRYWQYTGFSIPDTNQGFYIEFPEESLYRKELGYWENKVVVIGNIYDSPKLLEDKENKHGEDI